VSSPRQGWTQAAAVLVFAAAAYLLAQADGDPDVWGRITYARDAAAQGLLFLRRDIYSYTAPAHAWVDHEWGFAWVAWAAYHWGGWTAVRLLRLGLWAAIGALCLRPARHAPSAALPLAALVLALPLSLGAVGPRAQAFTCLFLAWELGCLQASERRGARWIVFAALPFPLWVNLHAGFLVGGGVLALWGGERAFRAVRGRDTSTLRALGAAALVGLCSLLATPWGPGFAPFVLRTAFLDRPYVPEWQPVGLDVYGAWWLLLGALCIPLARVKPRRWPELFILAVLATQAALHRRHLALFAVAAGVLALPALLDAWNRWRGPPEVPPIPARAGALGLGALAAAFACAALFRSAAPPPAEPFFPRTALDVLRSQHADNVLVEFNWAQYALFYGAPGMRVAIDGRYEAVYPPEVLQQYFAWHFGEPGWQALAQSPDTHYALVARGSPRAARMEALPDWTTLYADDVAVALAKRGRASDR